MIGLSEAKCRLSTTDFEWYPGNYYFHKYGGIWFNKKDAVQLNLSIANLTKLNLAKVNYSE